MKALVTRVNKATVFTKDREVASIDKGIVVFLGIEEKDEKKHLEELADKIINLRIFEENGKMKRSLKDKGYQVLCISNFTLCASLNRGRRPSFEKAKDKTIAKDFFEEFVSCFLKMGIDTKKGIFGEHMRLDLELDGPVNIVINI